MLSIVLTFFVLLSAVSAVDTTNVSIKEYSNLDDNDDTLSVQNKLEISNEDSISETNIVNSHDDNLGNSHYDAILSNSINSDYENNNGTLKASFENIGAENNSYLSSTVDNVVSVSSDKSDVLGAKSKIATKLSVSDTTYNKANTIFKVTLKDNSSNTLKNQKVSLKVNGKTFSATTNKKGVASIKTNALSNTFFIFSI